ncbi:MaoC family dehydratase [Craterilacuibacter sp. RT1T]|uniref:MaoC family dehydratase n=1 Tax=Craterilacuibacter sp. RT1T TaxID=2942211 RepID=UPI0020BDA8F9|nr:MaoC family dehydratase [Craterilacuibacter sp. RT1T]MCL6263259.1 MaoC family dehydratase [Craterilacuibacter sp. RT1T]
MANTVFDTKEALLAASGTDLGVSAWTEMTQARIDLFAEATGDHQWIHVDPARAKDGPFGCTIAHGYLTLSLASWFLPQLVEIRNMKLGVNVGCDRVRFPAPVPVNSRLRGRGEVLKVEETGGGVQATIRVTIEIDGQDKPGCVVDKISRYYF